MTSPEPPATVFLSDPGELIAATPVLIGFIPRSSLVAMSLGGASGKRLGLTLRIDLPPPEHIAAAAESVVHGMLLDDPQAVVLVVIGPGGDAGPPAAEFVERVMAGLASHAVDACHAIWTESTAAGSRWRCYDDCACTGIVPRSSASPLAAAARAEGRVVRADRAELERLVAPVDERTLQRREALLDTAIDAEAAAFLAGNDAEAAAFFADNDTEAAAFLADNDPEADALFASSDAEAAAFFGIDAEDDAAFAENVGEDTAGARSDRPTAGRYDPRAEVIEGIAVLDAALDAAHEAVGHARGATVCAAGDPAREVAACSSRDTDRSAPEGGEAVGCDPPPDNADEWLDDHGVVALIRALQVPAVRDAAIAACTGSRPAAAEALWTALTRGTPDPEAAEPAALLALTALLRGDGALANVALQRAESAWPGHRLTETLRGLAAAGIRPSDLRACLTGEAVPDRRRQRPKPRGRARGGASRSARRRRRRR